MVDYYERELWPKMVKKCTQTIYEGLRDRNYCLYERSHGRDVSTDMKYRCEYVWPKKIEKAVRDLTSLFEDQVSDLEKVGVKTHMEEFSA